MSHGAEGGVGVIRGERERGEREQWLVGCVGRSFPCCAAGRSRGGQRCSDAGETCSTRQRVGYVWEGKGAVEEGGGRARRGEGGCARAALISFSFCRSAGERWAKGRVREVWQCVRRALGWAEVERRGEAEGGEEGGRGKAAGCSVSPLSPFSLSASGHDEKAPLSVRRAGGRLPRAR